MSILYDVASEVEKVEHFLVGVAGALLPVLNLVNPVLGSEAKLAIDILTAFSVNTTVDATKNNFEHAITAIKVNPSLAAQALENLGIKSNVVAVAQATVEAVKQIQEVVEVQSNPTDGGGN